MPRPRRNAALERLIQETNDILEPAELALGGRSDTRFPLVLVIGAPRSGTTLTMQWLASSGVFAYPSNLMARFSRAPAIGARIQLLLTDPRFAFGEELTDLAATPEFGSVLGKTRGSLSPNEFWFFWRRFLACHEIRHLSQDELAATKIAALRSELAAIESVFDKPLAMKGMMLQYNLVEFARMLPQALFLHVERDGLHAAQSLIEAREFYYGSRECWYSAKPKEYEELKALPALSQVAGQVYYTAREIERSLARLPPARSLRIEYERLCDRPSEVWQDLVSKLEALGFETRAPYTGPASFAQTNVDRLPADELRQLREAWQALRERDR